MVLNVHCVYSGGEEALSYAIYKITSKVFNTLDQYLLLRSESAMRGCLILGPELVL